MYTIITILAVLLLVASFTIAILYIKNKKLIDENSKIKIEYQFVPGAKALLKNYGLANKSSNKNFKVDYEVEILEISKSKIKVSAYDFSTFDSDALKMRADVISFFQNQWVEKSEVEIILSDPQIRDIKLNNLGINI